MNRAPFNSKPSRILATWLVLLGLAHTAMESRAAFVKVGEIAQDFTLKNRKTGQLTSLRDFAGKIIFLDLFAYW